jgi:hypothetical protein
MKILPPNQNPESNNSASRTLFDEIKVKLQKVDTADILKGMGYNTTKTGAMTLEKFLSCNDIYDWLKSGHYDFRYSSGEFIEKLSTLLEVNSSLYKTEISHCTKIKNEYNKIRGCYVYVNTNFHRTTQPIFALAFMESHRLLEPANENLMFTTDKQILKNISKMVKQHYLDNDGELMMWGKIDNYVYHHFDGKQYVFDSDGRQLKGGRDINESRATISIK